MFLIGFGWVYWVFYFFDKKENFCYYYSDFETMWWDWWNFFKWVFEIQVLYDLKLENLWCSPIGLDEYSGFGHNLVTSTIAAMMWWDWWMFFFPQMVTWNSGAFMIWNLGYIMFPNWIRWIYCFFFFLLLSWHFYAVVTMHWDWWTFWNGYLKFRCFAIWRFGFHNALLMDCVNLLVFLLVLSLLCL